MFIAFLSHIAAVDGIFHLVRGFVNNEVMHVDDSVDPMRDMETIKGEPCGSTVTACGGVIMCATREF